MRRIRNITLAIGALMAVGAAVAWGAPANITNDPNANAFLPTTFNGDAGTVATFSHQGSVGHNVTATATGPDGKPLFSSATISSGSTPVNGTQFLPPGTYTFFCTIHGPSMSGTLVVGPGTPQATPTVAVKALDRKAASVAKARKLRVRVTTNSSEQAQITAKIGSKAISSPTTVSSPGTTVVKLKLNSKGVSALSHGKPKVTIAATVDFGSPATATAKLK